MEIQKVKLTQLPKTDQLDGTITLSVTEENVSSALDLTAVADAATSANEAATNANQAAENANTSAANADAKAEAAQKAADNATASANQADQAAVNANTATTRATAAAEKAENAADVAIGVVNEAQQATANANQAAQSANEAATNANQAATSANDAATEAHTQAEYAKTQGDYAKAEGDRVLAEKGQPGGLAELDESGRVPSSQLPSYVDDVVEYPSRSDFPATGESGKIYVATDTNLAYRWGGTEYVEISPSLALGTTAETAGRGDWTQAAYNHSLIKDGSNPHKTTFASLPDKDKVWTSDNFNPDNYLPKTTPTADGGVIVNGETAVGKRPYLKFHIPGVNHSQFVMDENGTVNLLNGSDQTPGAFKSFSAGAIFSNGKLVWDSGSFNPDDKFGFSAAQLSDLNNAPNNAFFVGALNAANAPVADSWSNGFTIAYGNNTDFRKQFCYAGEKWWTRGRDGVNWGTWRQIWDSGGFNPDNYLPLSGNKMITGDFQFKDGVSVRDAAGKSVVGLLDVAGEGVCVAVGNGIRKTRIITPDDTPVYRNDSKGSYKIYDSSNLGNATTSQAGLMSAADKTKLDGLSGGGLNIPASGEVAISGWTYNGKQVYAQRWTGSLGSGFNTTVASQINISAFISLYGDIKSGDYNYPIGSSIWNRATGEDIFKSSFIYGKDKTSNLSIEHWKAQGATTPTTYEVFAVYTK